MTNISRDFETGFQFLIGRLKTEENALKEAVDIVFQFLIGRLKTTWAPLIGAKEVEVSIPYR